MTEQQNEGAGGNGSETGATGNNAAAFDADAFFSRLDEKFKGFQAQGQQGQQSGAQSNNASGATNDQVLSELQALPEKIANVFKEANPGTKNGAQSNDGNNGAGSNNENNGGGEQEKTPGKKSLAERWFSR